MMSRDPFKEPDEVPSDTTPGGSPPVPVTHSYAHTQRELIPLRSIGPTPRTMLAKRITDLLEPISPHQVAVSVASMFAIAPARAGNQAMRVRAFLRLAARYVADPAVGALSMDATRASRRLTDIDALLYSALSTFYASKEVNERDLFDALAADPAALPLVELRYTCAQPVAQWRGFVHVQPALDLLLRQPAAAALSFRIERTAAEHVNGRSPLQLRVLALGAACGSGVLAALAQELCGRGVVVTDPPEAHLLPSVEWFPIDAAERDDIAQRNSKPGQPADQRGVDLHLTSADIAPMFPLPMPLYHL